MEQFYFQRKKHQDTSLGKAKRYCFQIQKFRMYTHNYLRYTSNKIFSKRWWTRPQLLGQKITCEDQYRVEKNVKKIINICKQIYSDEMIDY